MNDPLPWVRYNAVIALRKVRVDPGPLLTQIVIAFRTTNNPVACGATATAVALLPIAARDQGWDGVRQENGFTVCELIEWLDELGPRASPAIPELINALQHDATKAAAALALQKLGPTAVSQLNDAAMGSDVDLAIAAARMLGKNASPKVVDHFVRTFLGDDRRASQFAERALTELGPVATPRLAESLKHPEQRGRVAKLLARSDPARADLYADIIIHSMTDVQAGLARETSQWTVFGIDQRGSSPLTVPTQEWARDHGSALSYDFGIFSYPDLGPTAIPYLVHALSDSTRATCILNTLERMGEASVPALAQLLGANDRKLRKSVCIRLERMGKGAKAALPNLVVALSDFDGEMRIFALKAIRAIGPDKATITRLERLSADADLAVRAEVMRTLDSVDK
jgi:HEAT repeat protein